MMQFCQDPEDYDAKNPFHRIADKELTKTFNSRPDVCSRWLSILLHYRKIFYQKYKGSLANVPHPHIIVATNEYRSTQDKINVFINARGVLNKKSKQQPLAEAIELYIQWHMNTVDSNADIPKIRNGLEMKFSNSAISKYLKKDITGAFVLEGFRFLKANEKLMSGDTLYYNKHKITISDELPSSMSIPQVEEYKEEDDDDDDEEDDSDSEKHKRKKSKSSKKKKVEPPTSVMDIDNDEIAEVPKIVAAALINQLTPSVSENNSPMPTSRSDLYDKPFDAKKEGESFKMEVSKAADDIKRVIPESVEQYYKRMVREWEETKSESKKSSAVALQPDDEIKDLLVLEEATSRAQAEKEYQERIKNMTGHTYGSPYNANKGDNRNSLQSKEDRTIIIDPDLMKEFVDGMNDFDMELDDDDDDDTDNSDNDSDKRKKKKKKKHSKKRKHSKKDEDENSDGDEDIHEDDD
jgi:hypothetical protein